MSHLCKVTKNIVSLTATLICLSCLSGCAAVVVAGATTTGYLLGSDRREAGTMLDDNTTEVRALNALSKNKSLWMQGHVVPTCYNNVMLVVGQMPREELKKQVEDIIRPVATVRQFHNEITIEAPTSVAQRSKDSWITAQIKAKISAQRYINPKHIKIVTENGVVYLMGIIDKDEENQTLEIAKYIPGVKKVVKMFETR